MNEKGQAVDWWFIYKLPYITSDSDPSIASGFGYAYYDASTALKVTGKRLDQNLSGALGATVNQIFKDTTVDYIMWNDETPEDKQSESSAHAKGMFGISSTHGFFLRHSTPRWPDYVKNGYAFPDMEKDYGQTFLCVTVDAATISDISAQFLISAPQVYDTRISAAIASHYPSVQKLANSQFETGTSKRISFSSVGGKSFVDFAKSKSCDCDLYDSIVSPYYQGPMVVESWGRPLMASCCPPTCKYNVTNVLEMKFTTTTTFAETKDHSKWAITEGIPPQIVCIGDINRMTSQRERGGGTSCIQEPDLWSALKAMVTSTEKC